MQSCVIISHLFGVRNYVITAIFLSIAQNELFYIPECFCCRIVYLMFGYNNVVVFV